MHGFSNTLPESDLKCEVASTDWLKLYSTGSQNTPKRPCDFVPQLPNWARIAREIRRLVFSASDTGHKIELEVRLLKLPTAQLTLQPTAKSHNQTHNTNFTYINFSLLKPSPKQHTKLLPITILSSPCLSSSTSSLSSSLWSNLHLETQLLPVRTQTYIL